jgi:hypothetical protein
MADLRSDLDLERQDRHALPNRDLDEGPIAGKNASTLLRQLGGGTVGGMAQTVVLRKRWLPSRGVYASSLGVPQVLAESYPKGTLFNVEQQADGALVYRPTLQPPAADRGSGVRPVAWP